MLMLHLKLKTMDTIKSKSLKVIKQFLLWMCGSAVTFILLLLLMMSCIR